jgi:hypothetical protein
MIMDRCQFLSFDVDWDRSLSEVTWAQSGYRRLEHLLKGGIFDVWKHVSELQAQGWEKVAWNVSEDGTHEEYIFKRLVKDELDH